MVKAQKPGALAQQEVLIWEGDYGDSSFDNYWIAKWGFWPTFAFIGLKLQRKPGL